MKKTIAILLVLCSVFTVFAAKSSFAAGAHVGFSSAANNYTTVLGSISKTTKTTLSGFAFGFDGCASVGKTAQADFAVDVLLGNNVKVKIGDAEATTDKASFTVIGIKGGASYVAKLNKQANFIVGGGVALTIVTQEDSDDNNTSFGMYAKAAVEYAVDKNLKLTCGGDFVLNFTNSQKKILEDDKISSNQFGINAGVKYVF